MSHFIRSGDHQTGLTVPRPDTVESRGKQIKSLNRVHSAKKNEQRHVVRNTETASKLATARGPRTLDIEPIRQDNHLRLQAAPLQR
jgi:hypothetical protein